MFPGNTVFLALALAVAPDAAGEGPIDALRREVREGDPRQVLETARARLDEAADPRSVEYAELLDVLVEASWRGGKARDPETRELAARALALNRELHGERDLAATPAMNNSAVIAFFSGDYPTAERLWRTALETRRAALGEEHVDTAETMNNLANLLQTVGDYAAALPLYESSLAARERLLGADDPLVGKSLNNLATLLTNTGEYARALPYAERSLAVKQAGLGEDHPQVASSLSNLGQLLWETGDRERAQELFDRALAIWENAYGADHADVGAALQNNGERLRLAGDPGAAIPLFERTLAIWEKAYGPDHRAVANCLFSLAAALEAHGEDLARARALHERALTIREKALGPEHPAVGESLDLLAATQAKLGDLDTARRTLRRAIAVRRHALGEKHPSVAESLRRLAELDGDLGLALEAERIARSHLRLTGRSLAEEQALRYAATRHRGLDLAVSLIASEADARLVFDELVRSRAVVLDAIAARTRGLRANTDPEIEQLVARVSAARSHLANLSVRGPERLSIDAYRDLVRETRLETEEAERALAAASSDFARELERSKIGLADIESALPPKSALVSYLTYRRPDGARRYAAFVLAARKPVRWIDLGAVTEIDDGVADWKREVVSVPGDIRRTPAEQERDYRSVATELRRRAWDPVAEHLGGVRRVFVVPEGSLNLLSLASLPGRTGYLLEERASIHYLSAERDLVPEAGGVLGRGILALGGPDYAATRGEIASAGTRSGCGTMESLEFSPLPGAVAEVEGIVAMWERAGVGSATRLVGPGASEAELFRAVAGKRVLHMATHGFFLGGDCGSGPGSTRGLTIVEAPEAPSVDVRFSPLLLSGLALAGANRRAEAPGPEEDGILTAQEITGLDLSGVEWAVLSACDTGVGEIRAGEGVFGLRRAIQVAGARTLIMSLWPVDDRATADFMAALYRGRLERGLDSTDAVRNAARSVLRSRRKAGEGTHPFYWAAFVAAGDWR